MYRPELKTRDKSGAVAGVIAIHAALLFVFLHLSGRIDLIDPQSVTRVFDVTEVPPPQATPEPPKPEQEQQRPREEEAAASAENRRSRATPVVAPKPPIVLPIPDPVSTTQTPNEGTAPTQGTAPVSGPGTGAGGVGTGTGSGARGNGTGGGGSGGGTRASIIRGIQGRDYPEAIQRRWPRDGAVFVRLRIQPNGRASQCDVQRSFGDRVVDQWTCSLIMERGLFRPPTNERGEPIEGWYGYVQRPVR